MANNPQFDIAVNVFLESLSKKRDWKNLEIKLEDYKDAKKEQKKKILEWERLACNQYNKIQDSVIQHVKLAADSMKEEDEKELELWVSSHRHSKEVWKKGTVSIDDSMYLIKARVGHLIYMTICSKPVNISEIIKNKE